MNETNMENAIDMWNEITRLRAENEALTSELRQRAEQIGVACNRHDLTHSLACGQCMNELRAEVEALRLIRCPGGRMHRWDGDGMCKECGHYATDLIDKALRGEGK